MDNFGKEIVHGSEIRPGDTVLLLGVYKTVSKNEIRNDFLGWRVQGQPCSEVGKFPIRYFERLVPTHFARSNQQ